MSSAHTSAFRENKSNRDFASIASCDFQKRAKAQKLLDKVFEHLELVEKDYFCLQYFDTGSEINVSITARFVDLLYTHPPSFLPCFRKPSFHFLDNLIPICDGAFAIFCSDWRSEPATLLFFLPEHCLTDFFLVVIVPHTDRKL